MKSRKKPTFGKVIVFTLIVLVALFVAHKIYGMYEGPIESQIAVHQLDDNATTYGIAQAVASGAILKAINWTAGILLFFTWLVFIIKRRRFSKSISGAAVAFVFAITLVGLGGSGCGKYEVKPIEEIGPNETAFVVPLEGKTSDQGKFMSVEYLEAAKVAAKRIEIPVRKRDLGRGWWNYEWLPTMRVIKVDRSPVTREWTKAKDTGTSTENQSFKVESKESIVFWVGATITTMVTEPDAAQFLYYYGGKSLAEITDQNVRGFLQSILSREFGLRNLDGGRGEKAQIFQAAFEEVRDNFAKFGVTVTNLGMSEGLNYENPDIQTAINAVFQKQMDVQQAQQEKLAQVERNDLMVKKAEAERKAAQEFAKAYESNIQLRQLAIQQTKANAMYKAAENWNGELPKNLMPANSGFLFGLGDGMDSKTSFPTPAQPKPKPAANPAPTTSIDDTTNSSGE